MRDDPQHDYFPSNRLYIGGVQVTVDRVEHRNIPGADATDVR